MESLNIKNYNNNYFYSYLQKNDLIYTYKSIILNQSDQKVCLKCRESRSSYAAERQFLTSRVIFAVTK